MQEEDQTVKRPPNCGHNPIYFQLIGAVDFGYTEEYEHRLICRICEEIEKEPKND